MRITIQTINHFSQRYNTVGDWQHNKSVDPGWEIRVSKMSDWRYEFLVGVHELVEAVLCTIAGFSERDVDFFDQHFKIDEGIEPGDHPKAPYKLQHCIATGIERILAALLRVDWYTYEAELIEMTEAYEAQQKKVIK